MNVLRRLRALLGLSFVVICVSSGYAAPTSKDDAKKAVNGWLKSTSRPLKTKLSNTILNVSEVKNASGDTIYYVVNLTPDGYVIISPDDLIEPIIAFVEKGHYVADSENPMHSMLQTDMPNRIKHIKQLEAEAKKSNLTFAPNEALTTSKSKWNALTGKVAEAEAQYAPPSSIDDVRVDVLLETTWNQGGYGGDYLYNYYTPEHLVCGCVATTLAQILRHFKHPTVGIGQITSTACSVNGVNTHLTTRGGDGLGGPYDWDNMPGIPDASITLAQRQAIGALMYDAGVVCNMSYGPTSYSSNNNAKYALRDEFMYGNAIQASYPDNAEFATRANSNLESGRPCMVEVPGHSIIVDGYGYNSGTMYHHFNMGWGGGANGWYNVPNVYTYDTIVSLTYNIFVSGTGELISGKVKNALGLPQAGIVVTADDGSNQYTDISDDEGNYGIQVPSNTTFTVSCPGAAPRVVTTGTSADYNTCGNHWGQDFDCNNGAQLFYTPSTFNESIYNNGTITNSITITLFDDTFTGSIGADVSGNVTVTNLPTGLTAQFIKDSATQLTVTLTGNAVSHGLADDVNNLTFAFQNSAFTGGDASSVVDSTKSDLVIDFHNTTQELPYAIDAPHLTWTTGGSAEWFYQTDITHDGEDAGKSGVITHNQNTYMQTTLVGPGTLTFWWKVDSETSYDWLRVYIDGSEQAKISGNIDWELKTFNISAGSHVVKWEYKKDGSRSIPDDCAWVDEVVFSPDYVSYAVTYDGNGNTGGWPPNSQTKIEGVDLTLASNSGNLTKTGGYTFAGWNTAADGSGIDYSEGATYATDADLLLYAKWTTLPTYTITYDGNGNSGGTAPPNQTKIQGVDLPLASNTGSLVKAGYAFIGWNTASDGSGADHAEGEIYAVDANLDLFAKWSYTGSYPITVANHSFEEGADGSGSSINKAPWKKSGTGSNLITIQELSGIPGKADAAPDATDTTHYTNGTGDSIYQVLGATLAANTTYTLSVDVGDRSDLSAQPGSIRLGYVSASPTSTDDYGLNLLTATIINNTVPVNGAAADDGWETWVSTFTTGPAPAGLGQPLRVELVTDAGVQTLWDNVRLEGGAAVVGYSVTYDGNGSTGGTVPVDSNSYLESDTVTVLGNTGNLVNSGNTFTGWNTASNGSGTGYSPGSSFTMGTANVTLYAQWTAVPTYTVNYNGNGNTGGSAPVSQTKVEDVDLTLATQGGLLKTGYSFTGWNTEPNGSGTPYAAGGTYSANAGVTLYAQWSVNQYTITFDSNGGSAVSPITQDFSTAVIPPSAPTKSGYTFTGWSPAVPATMPASNTTCIAQWAVATYTLTVTNGTGDGDYAEGADITITADAPQAGYRFVNWTTSDDGSFADANASSTTYTMPGNVAEVTANYVLNNPPSVNAGVDQTISLSASAPWTPADITTCAWFDADDASTIVESGGRVSQWNDKSNNATPQNLIQATESKKPQTGVGTLNGRNVLTFDKTNLEHLKNGGWENIGDSGSYSIFIVANMTDLAHSSVSSINFQDDMYNTNSYYHPYGKRTTGGTTSVTYTAPAQAFIYNGNARYDASNTLPNSYFNLFVNGAQEGSDTAYDNPFPATHGAGMSIMTANNVALTASGIFAEAIITGTIDEATRQKIEGYLAHKWGLATNLPADHPYKTAAPGSPQAVANLNGTVSDTDVGDTVTTNWSVVSTIPAGLPAVTFAGASAEDTTATFTAEGVYTLRLTADDGIDQTTDDIVITVGTGGTPVADVNLPAGISLYGYTGANSTNAQAAFQTLIDNDRLSLVRWVNPANGQIKELYYTTFPAPGWVNEIGDLTLGQGYVVKTTTACTLSISGNKSTAPVSQDLPAGYSIIGYNKETPMNAQTAFQSLIDAGKLELVRWVDPSTGSIKELYYTTYPSAGWVNEIVNLTEGQGYIIKLNAAHSGFTLP